MVKVLSTIWLVVYVILTSGTTLNLHFCKGNFKSLNLFSAPESCCIAPQPKEETTTCCASTCSIEDYEMPVDMQALHADCCEDVTLTLLSPTEKLLSKGILVGQKTQSFDYASNNFDGKIVQTLPFLHSSAVLANPPPKPYYLTKSTTAAYILFSCLVFYA
ncbi:MAG: hypothetical protein ACXITV_06985 [Luteibaculaceae bacterium]